MDSACCVREGGQRRTKALLLILLSWKPGMQMLCTLIRAACSLRWELTLSGVGSVRAQGVFGTLHVAWYMGCFAHAWGALGTCAGCM